MKGLIMRWLVLLMPLFALSASADDLDQPSLGMRMVLVSEARESVKDFKPAIPTRIGMIVVGVSPNGPAASVGISPLSIITRLGGKAIENKQHYSDAVGVLEVGKPIDVAGYKLEGEAVRRWKSFTAKLTPAKHRDVVIGGLVRKDDQFKGTAFYTHPQSPENVSDRSELFAYIAEKGNARTLRIKLQYRDKDWLFIEKFMVHINGKNHEFSPAMERHVLRNGGIVEWCDMDAGPKGQAFLRDLVKAGKGTLRHDGSQFQKDRELADDEIDRIGAVLDAFDAMPAK